MSADPLRLMRQYRRPRTRVGRVWDRARFWVREKLVPCVWLVGTLTIPATAVMVQAGAAHATPVDTYTITADHPIRDRSPTVIPPQTPNLSWLAMA